MFFLNTHFSQHHFKSLKKMSMKIKMRRKNHSKIIIKCEGVRDRKADIIQIGLHQTIKATMKSGSLFVFLLFIFIKIHLPE